MNTSVIRSIGVVGLLALLLLVAAAVVSGESGGRGPAA